MARRKYLIGMIAGLVGAMAFTSIASAAVTGLSIESSVTPAKADKKIRRGVSTFFASNDTHAGDLLGQGGCVGSGNNPACFAYPPSVQSVVTFPKSLKFFPANLPDCNLAAIAGQSTAGARAACPRSIVGTGFNINKTLSGQTLNGVITAFNGAPSGGNASLYLHVDIAGVTTKPILNGVIRGNVLTVQIPPVPGAVIERFAVTINKVVSGKKRNKKTGKVKKTFYLMGNCAKPSYTVREDVTYQDGTRLSATTPGRCKRTKRKR
jgi:hypothetical protein